MFTIRLGMSLAAVLLASTLAGCQTPAGNHDPRVMSGDGDKLSLVAPEAIAGPNHTGPKQINAVVNLNGTDKAICIGPESKVYVVKGSESRKSYLVIEGVPCEK